MAEALLKKMVSKTKYKNFIKVQSAGTLKLAPSPAHDFAVDVCRENEIELYDHVSKPVEKRIVDESDIVFCLAQNHYAYLSKKYPADKEKFVLLKQYQNNRMVSIPSIADPIGHNFDFFRDTFNEIRYELKRVLPFLLSEVKRFVEFNKIS